MLKAVLGWGWLPTLITAVAVAGFLYKWEVWSVVPALIIILIIGLVSVTIAARGRQLERSSQKFKQLAGYFVRRFTGNSSLSIFAIIDSLFKTENPGLWDWARACDMSQRVFNTWCDGFIDRVESDIRTKSFGLYLRTYLNEFWLINNHHYEFVEQFYEVAGRVEVPRETVGQYNRFVMEYNAFVQNFRDNIGELKKVARTQIEPPSVKFAEELSVVKR